MKVKKAKLTWLFLDDSVGQRRLIEQAILDIDPDHKVLLAGTKAEAEEIIDKHPIDVLVVDYFLKGKTVDKKPITTESLIASARKRFRNLPIILISSAAGDDDHLLRVGADVAISKVSDLEANTVNLKTALKAALLKRSESAKKISPTDLYVPDKLEKSLRIASETSSGSVAIVGKRGMGKSTFAKMLGTHFLQGKRPGSPLQYYDCQTDPVARLTHAGRSNHSVPTEEPSPVIFGTQSSNLPGLLERSVGGVLILDNTLCLNKSTLRVLASFLTEGSLELPNGRRILCDDVRLICTAAEVTPVIENVLHRFTEVIRIPPLQAFLDPNFELIDVILGNRAEDRVSLEGEARRCVYEHALMNSGQVTIASLCQMISGALRAAKGDNRNQLALEDFRFQDELHVDGATIVDGGALLPPDTPLSALQWMNLMKTVAEGTENEATELVQAAAYLCAMHRAKGNKAAAARQLGIARQTLYKPVFARAAEILGKEDISELKTCEKAQNLQEDSQ